MIPAAANENDSDAFKVNVDRIACIWFNQQKRPNYLSNFCLLGTSPSATVLLTLTSEPDSSYPFPALLAAHLADEVSARHCLRNGAFADVHVYAFGFGQGALGV